jgi:two-component system sensor histidine kinase UhpB
MLAIVDHLQSVNRSMLNRLRPMALGHVPLADLVSELVRERARQHPDIAFRFSAGTLPPSYGEPIDLTVYRCIQEGLTNAIRHAGATRIDADLCERDGDHNGSPCLELVVRDNGRGFAAATAMGRGLLGMQERVQALAGACAIEGGAGQGARLRITIPVPTPSPDNVQSNG